MHKRHKLGILQRSFNGEVTSPEDPAYTDARNVLFGSGTPFAVVRPHSTSAVIEAIEFARLYELPLAVRGGGHSGAGFGTNNGGLVIDMAHFDQIAVSSAHPQLVSVGAGATWGAVAAALEPSGLVLSAGDSRSVGVAGSTLAGGFGLLLRFAGLAADQLVSAEIITADGDILFVQAGHNDDLFWALRGGGGNFGVVTRLDFAAHTLPAVFAGSIEYDPASFIAVATNWRDFMRQAPKELTTILKKSPSYGTKPARLEIYCCYAGNDEATMVQAIAPLLQAGKPLAHTVKRRPYASLLEAAPSPVGGMQITFENAFFDTLTDAAIRVLDSTNRILQIRSLGGMFASPKHPGAFGFRACEALIVSPALIPQHLDNATIQELRHSWQEIERLGQGAYSGLISDPAVPIRSFYPDDAIYEQLVAVKTKYDPENVFRGNFTIPPTITPHGT